MADENRVELEIVANTDSAKKSLTSFENAAEKSISKITDNFKLLAGAAAAALAFVGAKSIIGFLEDSASAAAANEAEVAKLEASLKSLGDFTPEIVQDFKDFADQLESTSKFSDDAAIAQIAFAKQLGLTNEDAKKLVQTAADLASVTGDSLESAVTDLTNSYVGQVKSLGKIIPEVKAFSEEQLKAGAAVDFIAERLKGAAANAINTYSGSLIQLANAQEDFQKEVGSAITQNPVLIEAIKASNEAFQQLTESVGENKEEINGYISTIIKLAVNAIPPLVDGLAALFKITGQITKGLTALVAVTADTIAGFLKFEAIQRLINSAVSGLQITISAAVDVLSGLLKTLAKIPGASSAFDALGFSIDEVTESLDKTAKNFADLSQKPIDFKKTIDGLENIRDGAVEFGDTTDTVFDGAEKSFKTLSKVARDTAERISAADGEIAKSAKARAVAETVAGQAAVKASVEASKAKAKALEQEKKDAEERKGLIDKFESFKDRILSKEISGFRKLTIERDRDLAENEQYQKAGLQSAEKTNELKLAILEDFVEKEKALKKKQVEDFSAEVASIATNPIKLIFGEIKLPTGFAKDFKDEIAGTLGAVSQILKGKEGATGFVAGLAGAFANAILPGIGSVVSEIVSVLAKGPEAVKGLVKEFVNAIPEIIVNIAEAIPAFVEAFIDTLVNKGGAVRIALAIAKGFLAVTFFPKIGKQIFGGFSADLPKFFNNLGEGFKRVFSGIGTALSNVFKNVFGGFINQIGTAFKDSIASFGAAITDVFGGVGQKLIDGIKAAFSAIGQAFTDTIGKAFSNFGTAILETFKTIGTNLFTGIKTAFTDVGTAIYKVFQDIGQALVDFISIPFDAFKEFLAKFKFPEIGGDAGKILGGGGGGGNKVVDALITQYTGGLNKLPIFKKGFKFAGGGVVPDGFPNDSAQAYLSSKEMVLPPDISMGLQDLIARGNTNTGSMSEESTVAILSQLSRIANLLAQPQEVQTTANVDGRAFAQIILQLSRQNARLSA